MNINFYFSDRGNVMLHDERLHRGAEWIRMTLARPPASETEVWRSFHLEAGDRAESRGDQLALVLRAVGLGLVTWGMPDAA